MKRWIVNQKISRKIGFVFFIFLLLSSLVTWSFYKFVVKASYDESMEQSSKQTLLSIRSNMYEMISTIDTSYNLLLKAGVTDVNRKDLSTQEQRYYDAYFFTIMDTTVNLSGIYIIDFENKIYAMDKNEKKELRINDISQAPWYKEVVNAKGSYVVSYNAGDIFENRGDYNYISVIRIINDINTQKPIGVAIFNININQVDRLLEPLVVKDDFFIAVYNEENILVSHVGTPQYDYTQTLLDSVNEKNEYAVQTFPKSVHISLYIPEINWTLLLNFPKDNQEDLKMLTSVFIIIILFNVFLLLLLSFVLSKTITMPINTLILAMEELENGDFVTVPVEYSKGEIGELQKTYNKTTEKIKSLIKELMENEKMKRQIELRVFQEQIKPHFLYNTLDSIAYVALTEPPEVVFSAIETLGDFYRSGLNDGDETVSIGGEIEIVKKYVALLKIRYDNLFEIEYQVQPDVLEYKIVKFILQPIVENSVYHGIKPLGEPGKIVVKIEEKGKAIVISVQDNGVGISKQKAEDILNKRSALQAKGFGLTATIERISLYYGDDAEIAIEKADNGGTVVKIAVARKKLDEQAEDSE